jgi:hypothetical protein
MVVRSCKLKGPVEGLNGRCTGGWQGSQLSGANVLSKCIGIYVTHCGLDGTGIECQWAVMALGPIEPPTRCVLCLSCW